MPLDVQVVNPLCFMVQKFLIQDDRSKAKQAQDILYVYDTLEVFGNLLPAFSEIWQSVVVPELTAKQAVKVQKTIHKAFSGVDDIIRNAARIPQDRKLSPEQLELTCQLAFEEIFAR